MSLVEEFEKLVDKRVDQRVEMLLEKHKELRPWVKMDIAEERLGKESRWIRDTFCTSELIEKRLVKKVGNEWHFLNPEFFEYAHDVWWMK